MFIIINPIILNRELVKLLHTRDVDVYLVSGGFHSLIEPVAIDLGIPVKHIFANKLTFYYDGNNSFFHVIKSANDNVIFLQ